MAKRAARTGKSVRQWLYFRQYTLDTFISTSYAPELFIER